MKRLFTVAIVLALAAPALKAQTPSTSLAGLWDAAVVVNGLEIPFRFEIAGSGSSITGSFFNGDEKVTSTGGKFENGSLTLNFDHYATQIEAVVLNGRLTGAYNRATGFYPFYARKFAPPTQFPNEVPQIDGLWTIGNVNSNKGESAWHFIVRQ